MYLTELTRSTLAAYLRDKARYGDEETYMYDYKMFSALANALEKSTIWIPLNKQLPTKKDANEYNEVNVLMWNGKTTSFAIDKVQHGFGIFAWSPISSPNLSGKFAATDSFSFLSEPDGLGEAVRAAINMNSAENSSNTPDFVLAKYLLNCLDAFDEATRERDRWYGEHKELSNGNVEG